MTGNEVIDLLDRAECEKMDWFALIGQLMDYAIGNMPPRPDGIWFNGDAFICETEEEAEAIRIWFDRRGIRVGYKRNAEDTAYYIRKHC